MGEEIAFQSDFVTNYVIRMRCILFINRKLQVKMQ